MVTPEHLEHPTHETQVHAKREPADGSEADDGLKQHIAPRGGPELTLVVRYSPR